MKDQIVSCNICEEKRCISTFEYTIRNYIFFLSHPHTKMDYLSCSQLHSTFLM